MEGVTIMSYGKMNGFASIVARTIGKDSEGFKTEVDKTIADVRCYHEVRHGSYRWANLAAFSAATDRFVIRFNRDFTVKPGYFINCGGVRYKIHTVDNIHGRDMYLEILAKRCEGSLG